MGKFIYLNGTSSVYVLNTDKIEYMLPVSNVRDKDGNCVNGTEILTSSEQYYLSTDSIEDILKKINSVD